MPPAVIDLGIGRIQLYTLALTLSILAVGHLFVRKFARSTRVSAIDVLLLALASGLALARVEHVLLNWAYFSDNAGEILTLQMGGLGWHGAVLGALLALGVGWRLRLRGERFTTVLNRLAPAVPLLMVAAWFGCWPVGCGYGYEVSTLADYPALIAAELPDIYGVVAPRLNTPLFGMAWGMVFVCIIWWARHMKGGFWLALGWASLGMFLIGFARADHVPIVFGLRLDQALDLIVGGFGLVCLARTQTQAGSV